MNCRVVLISSCHQLFQHLIALLYGIWGLADFSYVLAVSHQSVIVLVKEVVWCVARKIGRNQGGYVYYLQ